MIKLSFLLVNYNMRGLVEQCISSIDSQLADLSIPYEVLVADNSTQLEYAFTDKDSEIFKFVRILPIENKGWVNALNYLSKQAKGEYICIAHPDIEFNDECINKLLVFFEKNSSAGVISPNMTYPDGSLNKIRLRFPTLRTEFKRLINIFTHIVIKRKFIRDEILWDRKNDVEVDTVMSVCMLVRHEIIDRMKAVPDSFFMYFANDYICLQAKLQGFKNYYLKDASIIHYERFANQKLYSNDKKLDYKKTPVPVTDRMERDKFLFLKALRNRPSYFLFQMLSTLEFMIHALASIKQTRCISNPLMKKYFDTIRAVWKV